MRHLSLVFILPLFAACGRAPDEAVVPVYWSCDGIELAAVPTDAGLALTMPGHAVVLPAPGFAFQVDGETAATLGFDGRNIACTPKVWDGPWQAARERGATFRAVGQEPGWYVEVVPDRQITLVLDYGERTLALPAPAPVPLDGGARGYQAEAGGVVVQIVIESLICFDIMSGHVYPETTTVAVDGQRYQGCGLTLVAD